MKTIARPVLVLILLMTPMVLDASEPPSLAELARKADFVALAQVRDTDYLLRREIPVSGSAYLQVLIPYKTDMSAGQAVIEVYEKGLHEAECYFPNPGVFEEGRRYLLFLRRDPDDAERYRGLPEGCAIDVLVDSANGYAVRMPVTGIRLAAVQTAELEQLAGAMQFSDPFAVVADDALSPALRDAMLAAGQIVPYAPAAIAETSDLPQAPAAVAATRGWLYTQGIRLADFRALLESALAPTRDRQPGGSRARRPGRPAVSSGSG
jgi:hypothetical protein